MPLRRSLVLLLPLLAIGCAGAGPKDPPSPLALRLGTALEGADPSADRAHPADGCFERMAQREDAAIGFAAGGRQAGTPRLAPPASGAAEAAGQVLMPGFTALGDYAHGLAQLAAGEAIEPRSGPSGALLARAAEDGLQAVRRASGTVPPEPVRTAGLAGIAALSDLPDRMAATRGATVPAMVAEAAPHLAAVTALLRAVIGAQPGQGTRGAIRRGGRGWTPSSRASWPRSPPTAGSAPGSATPSSAASPSSARTTPPRAASARWSTVLGTPGGGACRAGRRRTRHGGEDRRLRDRGRPAGAMAEAARRG